MPGTTASNIVGLRVSTSVKCMLGFASEKSARDAFLAHYTDPRFLGPITAMPIDEFKKKVLATKDAPKMIKAILFLKAHNAGYSYTRGGKTVVVSPFDDRRIKSARVVAQPRVRAQHDDRTMDLFGGGNTEVEQPTETEVFLRSPNAREKAGGTARQRGFNSLGAPKDGYEHVYKPYGPKGAGYYAVPKGSNTPKWQQSDTITTPRSEMVKEHERLVDVLNSPSHKDDKAEAKKQEKELNEYKGAAQKPQHAEPDMTGKVIVLTKVEMTGLRETGRTVWRDANYFPEYEPAPEASALVWSRDAKSLEGAKAHAKKEGYVVRILDDSDDVLASARRAALQEYNTKDSGMTHKKKDAPKAQELAEYKKPDEASAPAPKVKAVRAVGNTEQTDKPKTQYDLGSGADVAEYNIGKSKKNTIKIRKEGNGFLLQVSSDGVRTITDNPMPMPLIVARLVDNFYPMGGGGPDDVRKKLRHANGVDFLNYK